MQKLQLADLEIETLNCRGQLAKPPAVCGAEIERRGVPTAQHIQSTALN